MKHAILIDFGSTFTKVAVASLSDQRILLTDKFPSTVKTDARVGLSQCFDAARRVLSEQEFLDAKKLSSSSAAGGLRMGVVGLTQALSITAGRNTAFGAGAKVIQTLSGRIDAEEVQALADSDVEIVLLCGGYENGNTTIVLHNANLLAQSSLMAPVIYAGNSQIATDVRRIFLTHQKECFLVSNLIPDVGKLDSTQAEEVIRDVFMKRIVNMKGLDKVSGMLDAVLMPTPKAVLQAGELLSRGTSQQEGFGPMMILDIGGATTDIHSYADQLSYEGAKIVGANEPYTRRTVEGDLGMRESSNSLAKEIGISKLAQQSGVSEDFLIRGIDHRVQVNRYLADSEEERAIDLALASGAARISARRHAGWIEHVHSASCKTIQHGKNLTEVRAIIGTGGPILFGGSPKQILQNVLTDSHREQDVLLPPESRFYLDQDYVLFAAGLLCEIDPDCALRIMKNSMKEI